MSRFYMTMTGGKSNSETITRRAYNRATSVVASYHGAIRVTPYVGPNDTDCVRITRENWQGSSGVIVIIYDGPFDVAGPYSTDLK